MMTRQHFEKVASLLKEFRDEIPQTTFEEIVMEFGDMFLAENERFDDARFQEACGITWPTFVRLWHARPRTVLDHNLFSLKIKYQEIIIASEDVIMIIVFIICPHV